jgi:hypothetical protein
MKRLDQFAELLAEGYTTSEASLLIYGTRTFGNSMLQRIRKRLGLDQTK